VLTSKPLRGRVNLTCRGAGIGAKNALQPTMADNATSVDIVRMTPTLHNEKNKIS